MSFLLVEEQTIFTFACSKKRGHTHFIRFKLNFGRMIFLLWVRESPHYPNSFFIPFLILIKTKKQNYKMLIIIKFSTPNKVEIVANDKKLLL